MQNIKQDTPVEPHDLLFFHRHGTFLTFLNKSSTLTHLYAQNKGFDMFAQ